jgi:hypothetical protein
MAEPGGIAVSRAVRDLAELKMEYAFVDGGEHQLKNVSRAVQVYHVRSVKAAPTVGTTTRIVPTVTLRFEGTDSSKQRHSFEVTLDKLMTRSSGMVIGRASDQCDLVVAHPTVSRRHAKLSLAGDALMLEDLGSTNGTSLDGKALRQTEPVTLRAGTKVRLGDVDMLVRQL